MLHCFGTGKGMVFVPVCILLAVVVYNFLRVNKIIERRRFNSMLVNLLVAHTTYCPPL